MLEAWRLLWTSSGRNSSLGSQPGMGRRAPISLQSCRPGVDVELLIWNGVALAVTDEQPGAVEMTRQVSSNPHATRGATRSALNPTSIANGQLPFIYNPPFVLDAKVFQKQNASAPPPPPLAAQDVEQDLKLMLRDARPDDELNEKLLQAAVNPVKAREYQVQPPDYKEPVSEITSHVRAVVPHLEVGMMGGVPMSAQSSMGGYSDAGDAAFGGGGVSMARTASGRGRGRRGA